MHSNGCNINYRSEYNELLERERKGERWLDTPGRTEEEINKNLPHYEKILTELNQMIEEHNIRGDWILNGFDEMEV